MDFDGTTLDVGSSHADPGPFGAGVGAELPYGSSLKFGDYQCRADASGCSASITHTSRGRKFADSGVDRSAACGWCRHPELGLKFSC